MNIYENYNFDYYNAEKKLAITVISNDNKFLGIIMDNNELILEVHYDKKSQNFIVLNGYIGEKLQHGNFSSKQKLERIFNLFNDKLYNYFNQNLPFENINIL